MKLSWHRIFIGCGIWKATEWIIDLHQWGGHLLSANTTTIKTHETTMPLFNNSRLPILGIRNAIFSCSWSLTSDSYNCYRAAWKNSLVGSAVSILFNSTSCLASEKNPINQVACIIGLDEQRKMFLKEKVQVTAILIILFVLWYTTLPKDQQNKKITKNL